MKIKKNGVLTKALAALTTVMPMLSATQSKTFAMGDPVVATAETESQDSANIDANLENENLGSKSLKEDVSNDMDDASTDNESEDESNEVTKEINDTKDSVSGDVGLTKTVDSGSASGVVDWQEVQSSALNSIAASTEKDRSVIEKIMTEMNDPSNDEIADDQSIMSLRSSVEELFKFYNYVDDETSSLSTLVYSGNSPAADLDNRINDLDRKVISKSRSSDNLLTSWKTMSTLLKNHRAKQQLKEDLAKMSSIKLMTARMSTILTECKTMNNSLKELDPTLTGDIQEQLDIIESSVRGIQKKTLNSKNMTSQAISSFSKQITGYFDEFNSIKENLNILLVDANKMTNEKIINKELSRIDGIEKAVDAKLDIILEKREMTDKQYARLVNLKSEIRGLFDKAHREIDGIFNNLSSKNLGTSECTKENRLKWNKLVNEVIRNVNNKITSWDNVMASIRKDDTLRRTWDPIEGPKLLLEKMRGKTKVIIEDKQMNIKTKMLNIARSINGVQPGTGTALIPLIRSFLDPNRTLNVTDEFGNIVADRLAPYSFQLTGIGGSGKTSGAKLLAEAFGADVIVVGANDLKDQNAFNLKKNELVTKMGASSKRPVLVIFDEVDTGTCVVTDAAGNRLNQGTNDSAVQNRQVLNLNGTPAQLGTWKFKYKDGATGADRQTPNGGRSKLSAATTLSSHLQRDERGFVNFSEFIRILDQGPNGKVLGIVSTSNYRLDQMPGEVARRIAPTGNEIYVSKPSARNLSDIIKIRFPALSFSDGYGIKEGAELIGEQAFRYNWTAPKLITNLNQLANAIKDSSDPKCALPCKSFCKFIAGTIDFQQVVDESKAIKQELELKSKRDSVKKQMNAALADTGSADNLVTEQELKALEEEQETDRELQALLNGEENS